MSVLKEQKAKNTMSASGEAITTENYIGNYLNNLQISLRTF